MTSWQDLLGDLRGPYVRESLQKLDEAQALLATLDRSPDNVEALARLVRRFHGFAGSGTSYGFAGVTELARDGEAGTVAVQRAGRAVNDTERRHWHDLLDAIRIDLAQEQPPRVPASRAPEAPPAASRVLLVDDDAAITEAVSRVLQPEGYELTIARTQAEALAAVATLLPDAVIADVLLPDGSGFELVERIRALPGGDRPVVLVISVLAELVDKVEAILCGADGYFEKPVEWDALLRRLRLLLARDRVEPARVLSVEDDPQQAAFLRVVLESAGYEFRVCPDPSTLEHDLLSFRPDLLLMDLLLPTVAGHTLTRYLRQHDVHASLPIVVCTTQGQIEARVEAVRAGADDFLMKPVEPGLLLSTVAARIERARFLRSLVERDGLTSLLTHTAFLERARGFVARRMRDPALVCAWIMIDLDDFKVVNDRHGHPAGDRVLAGLSSLLRRRLRQSDVMGRYGGEEFAVLVEGLAEEEAVRLVQRLLQEFCVLLHRAPGGGTFAVGFSAGVSVLEAPDLDRWLARTEAALAAAKRGGRRLVVGASSLPPASRP
jgi:diguanylate cyclase (GGDEF)-like protein